MSFPCNPNKCESACPLKEAISTRSDDSNPRRDFLKIGMASLAAAAGGLALPALALGSTSAEEEEEDGAHCGSDERLPALSTDGKLIDPATGKPIERQPDYGMKPGYAAVREGIPNRKWVMVIDLAKCDGCEKCTASCSKAHKIPPDRQWIRVHKMRSGPEGKIAHWFPKPCFHCDDPPCTRVCPVDATFKRKDGIVLIDSDRCIGCRFCMAACPYSTRAFNWGKPDQLNQKYTPETSLPRKVGTVEKCDFCPDMLRQGKLPHCVSACTMGALMIGDFYEDAVSDHEGNTYRLSTLLQEKGGYRYLEELGTKPSVYYLPPKAPVYDPPVIDPEEEPIVTS